MRFAKRLAALILAVTMILGNSAPVIAEGGDEHSFYAKTSDDWEIVEDGEYTLEQETFFTIRPSEGGDAVAFHPENHLTVTPDNIVQVIPKNPQSEGFYKEFLLKPLANSDATITYTDGEKTATMKLTVEGVAPLTYSYHVIDSDGFLTKIEGSSYQVTDVATDFQIRDSVDKPVIIGDPQSDFEVTGNLGVFGNKGSSEFRIVVFDKIGGTVTHTPTGTPITIDASGVPTSYSLTQIAQGGNKKNFATEDNINSQNFLDRSTLTLYEQPGIDVEATLSTAFIIESQTGSAFTYTFEDGVHKFDINRLHTGSADNVETSTITLATTIDGTKYTFSKTIHITRTEEDIVTIPHSTIDAVNTAIANVSTESTAARQIILQLPGGNIIADADDTIHLSKRVTLRGGNNTVIKGGVNITANVPEQGEDGAAARLENLTLDGNGAGTGITGTGYAAITQGVTIKNFEVGFDNTKGALSFAFGGIHFEGNNTALILKSVSGQRQSTGGFTFKNNETAIQIVAGSNPNAYAFKLHTSNFIENDVNIQNDTNIAYNFALNHYDDVTKKFVGEQFTNTPSVVYYPYYDGKLELSNGIIVNEAALSLIIDKENLGNVPIENGAVTKLSAANFAGENVSLTMDGVNPDGSASKVASWGFDANPAPILVTVFNPTIGTKLQGTSDNAVETIPADATYQPVSFAHSGALPGVATVNLVKTEAAPTTELKLYKVVGNQLVKQPEAVTFDGTEYTFLRPDCSDYIITDAEISSTVRPPNSGSSSGGSASDYTSSGEIASAIGNASNGVANIAVSSRPLIGSAAFDTLRSNPGTTLILQGDGYSWSFKGSDITANIPGLIYLNTKISDTSPNQDRLSRLAGGAELLHVYFSHHGQLPGKATISVAVPAKYNGQKLNVYYYNERTGSFETIRLNAPAQNGRLSFDITHCSDYVITPAVLSTTAPKNPSTGAHSSDGQSVMPVLTLILAVISVYMLRSKNKKAI